jgi:hypothetical protein
MWKFLCRYLITSYPLMGWLFFRCLRIIMSMKSWIILRLKEYAILDSKATTVSKVLYVLEYKFVCL